MDVCTDDACTSDGCLYWRMDVCIVRVHLAVCLVRVRLVMDVWNGCAHQSSGNFAFYAQTHLVGVCMVPSV